jgi:hypothetical protein
MRDARTVRRIERVENPASQVDGTRGGHWPAEFRALDELHDEIIRADVVKRADIGMIQRRDRTGFPLETVTKLFRRNLDGDIASEAGIPGLPDFAHASLPDERYKFIRTEQPGRRGRGHEGKIAHCSEP